MKFILFFVLLHVGLRANDDIEIINNKTFDETKCKVCDAPDVITNSEYYRKYKTFDIRLKDGSYIYNVISASRELVDTNGIPFQEFLRINYKKDNSCVSVLYDITEVSEFSLGDIGSGGQPLTLPIKAARFFQRKQEKLYAPNHHFYLQALIGYTGPYENEFERNVGINNFYYGGGLKYLYGNKTKLGINAEIILENGRARMPLGLEGRYIFWGGQEVVKSNNTFYPSQCQFQKVGDKVVSPNDNIPQVENHYKHLTRNIQEHDETVYYTEAESIKTDPFRLFLYGEGGSFFDLFDEGQGASPAINENDFGQYYFGAGFGAEIFNNLDLMIGVRYMRLNLRTPCEECNDLYVLNTNEAISLLIKLSYSIHK